MIVENKFRIKLKDKAELKDETNVDVKSVLAKLMAQEGITVIFHPKMTTAGFDPKKRTLYMPNFVTDSPSFLDQLLGHEVGHALFTGKISIKTWKKDHDFPFPYFNVVEDARIDRKIQKKFMGLRKHYVAGGKIMIERDFFKIKDRDLNSFNLADRINLHFKIGNLINVPFARDEMDMVKMVEDVETVSEAITVARELYNRVKDDMVETDKPFKMNGDDTSDSDESDDNAAVDKFEMDSSGDTNDDSINPGSSDEDEDENDDRGAVKTDVEGDDSDDSDNEAVGAKTDADVDDGEEDDTNADGAVKTDVEGDDSDDSDNEAVGDGSGDGAGNQLPDDEAEPKVETDQNLNDALEGMIDVENDEETARLQTFSVSLPNHSHDGHVKKTYDKIEQDVNWMIARSHEVHRVKTKKIVSAFDAYAKKVQRTVNYMAREFEMKKRASEYKHQTESKTGKIDLLKLHSYLYNDDIFKKSMNVKTGKNHGLFVLVDWSTSMMNELRPTIQQMLTLAWFAKKINIPFDIWTFTSGNHREYKRTTKRGFEPRFNEAGAVNLLSSKMTSAGLRNAMMALWIYGESANTMHGTYGRYGRRVRDRRNELITSIINSSNISSAMHLGMGGTPLMDALAISFRLMDEFKTHHGIEVMNFALITDGYGDSFRCRYLDLEGNLVLPGGQGAITDTTKIILTDEVTNSVAISNTKVVSSKAHPGTIVDLMKVAFNANTVGFYLTKGYEVERKAKEAGNNEEYIKHGFARIAFPGFDSYFLIPSENMEVSDGDRDITPDNFGSVMSGRKLNKVLLTKVVDIIA